ncbi:uncharacterized protein LOC141632075 [Silene latifolia]|uniref:uncharacterized protein LOC141632075 n=1 Tax=Silene latifolia TaxID=37657 RepID=UPI003D77882A
MARTSMFDAKRGDPEYDVGLAEFYSFVRENVTNTSSMACPCDMCLNMSYMNLSDVKTHLQKRNFNPKYRRWTFHGESRITKGGIGEGINLQFSEMEKETCFNLIEKDSNSLEDPNLGMNSESVDESDDNSENIWGDFFGDNEEEQNSSINVDEDIIDDDDEDLNENDLEDISIVLYKLKDTEMPLYKSCKKYTKLASIIKLYNLKAKNRWSDKSFNDLLELVKDVLPEDNVLPNRTYEAKKILRGIGMKYEKIHACPNDCILYRKEYETCTHSTEDAKLLTWHKTAKTNDGKLRHPADGLEWMYIDSKYPEFGKEPRNLHLALSTDGINPYGNLSSQHSTWPVLLGIYNLPPFLCMKRKYLMLSLLISGPQEPGNDIDVNLAPLLDDLKLLWDNGIEVFDAYQNSVFNLKAMLLCTISDFPAYGNLCGHTVHGKEACPLCGEDVDSCYLTFSRKQAYLGYRRFLEEDHSYRRQQKVFNGKPEHRPPPKILTGNEVYEKVKDIQITYGKKGSKLASRGYKKMSPLFEQLPYWCVLSTRHYLDVMHIEKNVCDNIINTLLNVPNKSKDNKAARKDMMDMKIRPELAPQEKGTSSYLPPAAHTLSKKGENGVLSVLAWC